MIAVQGRGGLCRIGVFTDSVINTMASQQISLRTFSIVVAKEKNGGIGYNSSLPWPRLKTDLKFLKEITTRTDEEGKQNAIIFGRNTWESIPEKIRPLPNRFNVILSSRPSSDFPGAHYVDSSLTGALSYLSTPPLSTTIENVYILGGTRVYKEAMDSPLCDKLYMTEIFQEFQCDTFWPQIDETKFKLVKDTTGLVPEGIIEENGVSYKFLVYQRL